MKRRRSGGFVWCALFISVVLCRTIAAAEPVVVSKIGLRTRQGRITADVFEQAGAQKRPAILVLHGAGGTLLDGPAMRRTARALAADGNAVYLLHYFQRTGTIVALDSTMQRHFGDWVETVRDSIKAVQEARGDATPVGIYGYSLGAFLALRVASDNPRVGAVVEHAGGVFNETYERIGRVPPVLMVHGQRDGRVPFARYAQPLIPVLRRRAAKLETRFFPEEGHGFSPAAMAELQTDAARFFRRHLQRAASEAAATSTTARTGRLR
jgi:dienelactone hydrolase